MLVMYLEVKECDTIAHGTAGALISQVSVQPDDISDCGCFRRSSFRGSAAKRRTQENALNYRNTEKSQGRREDVTSKSQNQSID